MTQGSVSSKVSNFISAHKRTLENYAVRTVDFSRSRKLGIVHLVGHILFLTAQRNQNGYAITSQNYFSQLGKIEGSVARSSLCEARQKLGWQAFEFLLTTLNQESKTDLRWKGLDVGAVDGTNLTLPATEDVLEEFPRLTKNRRTKSHYPKGKLVTAMNVLTGQPICAVVDDVHGSERECLLRLLPNFKGHVLLLDRGFEGMECMVEVAKKKLFFVLRLRASGRGQKKEVKEFIASRRKTAVVTLNQKINKEEVLLKVRLIRGEIDREGNPIILVTNLLGRKTYAPEAIYQLYLARWRIETMYYRVKELLKLQAFHAQTVNGVLQEIWSNLVLLSLTAVMTGVIKSKVGRPLHFPNFKAATEVIRRNFSFFVCRAKKGQLEEMLRQIASIECVKQPGRKNPRISKQPHSHWIGGKKNRLHEKQRLKQKKKAAA